MVWGYLNVGQLISYNTKINAEDLLKKAEKVFFFSENLLFQQDTWTCHFAKMICTL